MRHKLLFVLSLAALLLWTGFIFSNSLENGQVSMARSQAVLETINPRVTEPGRDLAIAQNFIRKLAHFLEFFLLGILWYFTLHLGGRRGYLGILPSVLTAFADEGLQMFSDRGNSLSDVFLDSLGAAAGILTVNLFLFLFLIYRKQRAYRLESVK